MPKLSSLFSSGRGGRRWRVLAAVCIAFVAFASQAAEREFIRIAVVTFLSGPASGPFGIPARNAAELLVEGLNEGTLPEPHHRKGFGGVSIEVMYLDEAGGTTRQENQFRGLVQDQDVDMVIGYISSADCLAVAPVAEELKKLTLFFDCGSPRIFEERNYKYVFRPVGHATMDNVGAALYAKETMPKLKTIAGINQNYPWGQDSWRDFESSMKVLLPQSTVVGSQMPKLWAGQYQREIEQIMAAAPDIVHSSFWGSDLDSLVSDASKGGLFEKSRVVLTAGETAMYRLGEQIPDGTILGARGPNGPFAPNTRLNKWFRNNYLTRHGVYPVYPAYHMAQAILGAKAAFEKAQLKKGQRIPLQEEIIAAFEGLSFEGPSGKVKMALGKGHQAVQGTAYGTVKTVDGDLTLVNVKHYPPERVNPPEGTTAEDWIKAGLKTSNEKARTSASRK